MYTEPTVIITGAGASWHYGYPTGPQLIKEIVSAAEPIRTCLSICRSEHAATGALILRDMDFEEVMHRMTNFIDRIYEGNPEVIDYFIGANTDLEDEAKFLISYVILGHEWKFLKADRASYLNGNDDWLRFVAENICRDCSKSPDLFLNKINFVTFNYDTSLEQRLFRTISARKLFEEKDIRQFIFDKRIFHVYGSVNQGFDVPKIDFDGFGNCLKNSSCKDFDILQFLNVVSESAQKIRVIDPQHKELEIGTINSAQDCIKNAKRLYMLDYGFDKNNNRRIALDQLVYGGKVKEINYTNFNNTPRVAYSVFESIAHQDSQTYTAFDSPFVNSGGVRFRPCAANVYDALAQNFNF